MQVYMKVPVADPVFIGWYQGREGDLRNRYASRCIGLSAHFTKPHSDTNVFSTQQMFREPAGHFQEKPVPELFQVT